MQNSFTKREGVVSRAFPKHVVKFHASDDVVKVVLEPLDQIANTIQLAYTAKKINHMSDAALIYELLAALRTQ